MTEETRPEIKAIEKKSKLLADVVSRTVAPLIGAITGGPLGSIAGGVIGSLIRYNLEDFLDRFLTPKEVRRVGTSAEFIVNGINRKLKEGKELNETIFESSNNQTSEAEQLFEGVLIKCKNEYQDKKLKYVASIFINASFDPLMTGDNANQILNIAEKLTYRQICLLALIGRNKENKYNLRTEDNRKNFYSASTETGIFLIRDFRDLETYGLIHRTDNLGLSNFIDPAPSKFTDTILGWRVLSLMNLDEIPDMEFAFIDNLQ